MVQTSFDFESEQSTFIDHAAPSHESSQLVGQLNCDGIASLKTQSTAFVNLTDSGIRQLPTAAGDIATSGSTTESGGEEDYDAIQTNPATIVDGAEGGGIEGKLSRQRTSFSVAPPGPTRLKSIPITLNKLEEKGKYVLTADKKALREILKMSIERVSRASLEVEYNRVLKFIGEELHVWETEG
jgi:sterol O-acyltransferase